MLSLPMEGEYGIYRALYALRLSRAERFLEELRRLNDVDPVAALLATLLQPLYARTNLVIVSPWIEDVAFVLSPSLSTLLGLPRIIRLSTIAKIVKSRGLEMEIVTRSSLRDTFKGQSRKRALLYALARIEPLIDERIHTKCVATSTHTYILTANITERELTKTRRRKNVTEIADPGRCRP